VGISLLKKWKWTKKRRPWLAADDQCRFGLNASNHQIQPSDRPTLRAMRVRVRIGPVSLSSSTHRHRSHSSSAKGCGLLIFYSVYLVVFLLVFGFWLSWWILRLWAGLLCGIAGMWWPKARTAAQRAFAPSGKFLSLPW
jgi:hypothetical protein